MTVRDLIRELSAMPQDADVDIETAEGIVEPADIVSVGGGPDGVVTVGSFGGGGKGF